MPKNLEYSILLDCYGELLTEKQRETLDYYYNEDLSLSEISEIVGISRQGVMDIIKRSEQQLNAFEQKLSLKFRFKAIDAAIDILSSVDLDGLNAETKSKIELAISKLSF